MPADLAAVAGPMVPTMYRVVDSRRELADTTTLTLAAVGDAIDPPAPGQFTMLWAFGVGEAPISLAGLGPDGELVHTIRAVGAVTTALASAQVGDTLGVRGPFGAGWDVESARGGDVLVVAGGLGIAPVRPIVTSLLDDRDAFGRITLLLGARTPDDLLYASELGSWAGRADLEVRTTVDAADPGWRGNVGVVTRLLERAALFDPARTTAFVCGPEIMMRFTAVAALDRGVAPERVWLSMERNMHCAIGHCGHCQLGPMFVCKDGPVAAWPEIEPLMKVRQR